MRKLSLVIIVICFAGINFVQSQGNFKSLNEIKQFKQQLREEAVGNTMQLSSSLENKKAGITDYGNAPAWNWASDFGGSDNDYGRAVVTDTDGNIYALGSFSGVIYINGDTTITAGNRDAGITKFDNAGNVVWIDKVFPEQGEVADAYGMCVDADNNIYVTGYYTGTLTVGSITLPAGVSSSLFVVKFSPQDEVLLAFNYSLGDDAMGLNIDTDSDGNIYVVGSQYVTTDYRHASLILKFDASGSLVWEQAHDESFSNLVVTGSSIYFAGTRQSGDDGILDDDVSMDYPVLYGDAFVAKATLDGNFTWAVMAGHDGSGDSHAENIAVDANENVFLAGSYRTNLIFGSDSIYNSNGFIAKFSSTDSVLWMKDYGDEHSSYVYDLITDNNNNLFVAYSNSISKFDTDGSVVMNIDFDLDAIVGINISAAGKIVSGGHKDGLMHVEQMNNAGTREWEFNFEGNSGYSKIINTATDNSGHVYIYGYASANMDYFGETIHKGLFLTKQKGTGDVIWLKEFTNAQAYPNIGTKMIIDPANEFLYVVGYFEENLAIGNTTLIPVDEGSIFIAKFTTDGVNVWGIKEDVSTDDVCLAADYSGNLVLSGVFQTDSITIGGHDLTGQAREVFIAKYNASGSNLWAISAGGDDNEYVGIISTDQNDNIYLTGEFDSENQHIGNYTFTLAEGDGNVLFAKLSPGGETRWAKAFAGSTIAWGDWYCWATGITTDSAGFSYIKGWHGDSVYFDNILLTTPNYYYSYFVAKIDAGGNAVWANSITESLYGFDYNQMAIDEGGNVYLGAQARDTLKFGTDFTYVPAGTRDLFIAKYSTNGTLDWVKTMESNTGYNWLSAVSVVNPSSIFVSGYFTDYISFGDIEKESLSNHGFIALIGNDVVKTNEVYNRNNQTFSIYPNPSNGIVQINANGLDNKTVEINIVNIAGQAVYNGILNTNSINSIDLSYLSKGIYFIQSVNQSKIKNSKLIIQ
ncbi:MAG: T9SS type A sorting domain-containing protein [Chlorobi bacterium]|nr:T9SS type A sorting domain-containing protein [Chlorobiota bacterium]